MSFVNTIIKTFVGDKAKKDVKAMQPLVAKIKSHEAALEALSNDALRQKTLEFKKTIRERNKDLIDQIDALDEGKESLGLLL